jgi:hypothetical protein
MGIVAPAFGERGPVSTSKAGVAGKNGARLLIRVFGEVAQDHDDLVLDVEPHVAVVAEVLAFGDDEPVPGKHDRSAGLGGVGEGQSQHVIGRAERACWRAGPCHGEARPSVLGPSRELERVEEILCAGQRPGADAGELARDVLGGQALAGRARHASFEFL